MLLVFLKSPLDPFCTKGSALPYEVFTEHLGIMFRNQTT